MNESLVSIPCLYHERRIVFIMLGLSNSGKTTRANALKSRFEGRGLKSTIRSTNDFIVSGSNASGAEIEACESKCRATFISDLEDISIRRIFVDNNNLDKRQRDFYIQECEKRDVEWVIVAVGRFTNQFADECYRKNSKADWATYRRELQLWGEYYRSILLEIETLKSKGFEEARMMRGDTRIVATRMTEQGREVVFGIKANGSYVRAFIFSDATMGSKAYSSALTAEHRVDKEDAKMTIGRRYNGSLVTAA